MNDPEKLQELISDERDSISAGEPFDAAVSAEGGGK